MMKQFMSRFGLLSVIFVIAMLVFPISVNAGDFSADMISRSSMGTVKGKVFFKEGNFRQETVMGGRNQITIFRKDKKLLWVLMPEQMMYMEVDGSGGQNMRPVDPNELETMGKKEYLGKEEINGYQCSKYRYTPKDASHGAGIYWISEKLNFPIKMEMDGPSGHMVTEYRNISEKTISGALFDIPSGYQKMSIPMIPGTQNQ